MVGSLWDIFEDYKFLGGSGYDSTGSGFRLEAVGVLLVVI